MAKCDFSKEIKFYGKNKKVNKRELVIGERIEREHTNDKKIAKAIATAHLMEFPNYYTKGVIPMEKRLKKLR